MNNSGHTHAENPVRETIKYEIKITQLGWFLFLGLLFVDAYVRHIFLKQPPIPLLISFQVLLLILFIVTTLIKISSFKKIENAEQYKNIKAIDFIEILILILLISTFYYGILFSFIFLLPLTFFSLAMGFKKSFIYILFGGLCQLVFHSVVFMIFGRMGAEFVKMDLLYITVIMSLQYFTFTLFSFIFGKIYNEYLRSEEENTILIDRLGDKYVQLEQAKREIQTHYEKMRETNNQLEDSNSKLTSSLAEFYTLQQISQAITSIFDMNELLKFVNDVIIGVMGVYHSTIALCYGPQNKLKVQVSSIFEKKDLAIMSDYINCDILKPSTDGGHSMIDNAADPNEYPFTKGRNIQSLICVPLLAKGNTLGIVLIEHTLKEAFDKDNVRLLEVISQQVSIAIENARLYQQMHDLATLDGLTGAYNRLYFQDKLEEEFKKAQEKGYDLSFIIFDIDHFKKFNDTYGHLFGDLVLKTLSAHIMKTLRKEDIFARYGGEEFVILMPHTTLKQAHEKAEELRISISQLSITDRVVSASITVSIGVSTYPESAGRPQDLISTADDALYDAKHEGRNLVRSARVRK